MKALASVIYIIGPSATKTTHGSPYIPGTDPFYAQLLQQRKQRKCEYLSFWGLTIDCDLRQFTFVIYFSKLCATFTYRMEPNPRMGYLIFFSSINITAIYSVMYRTVCTKDNKEQPCYSRYRSIQCSYLTR